MYLILLGEEVGANHMKILMSFIVAFGLAACQTPGGSAPKSSGMSEEKAKTTTQVASKPSKEEEKPEKSEVVDKSVDVTFLDLSGFDDDLSGSLRGKNREVVVNMPAKFSLNDIPERMDVWFSRIKESGGKVQAKPLPKKGEMQTRGLLGLLIDIGVSAYAAAAEERMYRPADDYNVILEYDPETGEVQNAIFYHR